MRRTLFILFDVGKLLAYAVAMQREADHDRKGDVDRGGGGAAGADGQQPG